MLMELNGLLCKAAQARPTTAVYSLVPDLHQASSKGAETAGGSGIAHQELLIRNVAVSDMPIILAMRLLANNLAASVCELPILRSC